MQSHVTPAQPIQIFPGTFDKSIRKETLGIDQPEDVILEFQELCEKSLPANDAYREKWASKTWIDFIWVWDLALPDQTTLVLFIYVN